MASHRPTTWRRKWEANRLSAITSYAVKKISEKSNELVLICPQMSRVVPIFWKKCQLLTSFCTGQGGARLANSLHRDLQCGSRGRRFENGCHGNKPTVSRRKDGSAMKDPGNPESVSKKQISVERSSAKGSGETVLLVVFAFLLVCVFVRFLFH